MYLIPLHLNVEYIKELQSMTANQAERDPPLLWVNPQPGANHVVTINIITWQVSKHHPAM